MEGKYFEEYGDIIRGIESIESSDKNGNPWYSKEFDCPAIEKLKEKFPNVSFSVEGLMKLTEFFKKKEKNDNIIYDLSDSKYGVSFYDSHGHMKTEEEEAKYREAVTKKDEIDGEYAMACEAFFKACETLNNTDKPSSIEEDAFEPIYKYGFTLRPKDTMLKGYCESYLKFRGKQDENQEIVEERKQLNEKITDLQKENSGLQRENGELKQKVNILQKMLSRTLAFCERVRNSRVGKLFFRKDIKELPSADESFER